MQRRRILHLKIINSKNMFMKYFGSKAVCDLQCNYELKLEIHAMEQKYKFGLKN